MSKKLLSLLLVLVLLVGCFASCSLFGNNNGDDPNNDDPNNDDPTPGYTSGLFDDGMYTYNDAVSELSANWNPHTYQTTDESYPIDFLTSGLYSFIYNDELNPVEGKDPYAGYKIVPEMAASEPVDVTEAIKAAHPGYGIPASATSGYAYTIALNKNAVWQNGTPITAETYVYSMKMLLDPIYENYRATDYFDGSFSIANAREYYYQGETAYTENMLLDTPLSMEDLTKNADGVYCNAAGAPYGIAVKAKLSDWLGNNSLADYVGAYGDDYFNMENWDELLALADKNGWAPLTDESLGYLVSVISTAAWGEDETCAPYYFGEGVYYAPDYSFDNVGIFASGEKDEHGNQWEITIVLDKSLAGFNLLYNLSGNWIVYQPYYDSSWTKIENTEAYSTTYNTSPETTMSYGPYKMTNYVLDKSMTFERNENWFGYKDGKHIYVDPYDGKTYEMYQTDKIYCQVVEEAETRKLMFLSGQLMGYGLQADDFAEYRDSEYCYATPSETIFFFVFNGNMSAIKDREANDGFDQTKTDLETMTLNSFRRAWAVSFNKEDFCAEISPSRSGGYGLIGNLYLYDPETGARYRDTDQAKQALCDFYSVDVSKFESLDDAVDSITGYDPVKAKELYTQAYQEAIEAGYITDADGDGKSDQVVTITYSASVVNTFIENTVAYFNEELDALLVGTPFEGKIKMVCSAPLGDPKWSDDLKAGKTDTCLCGWSGSALDPFGLTDLYTNPAKQYDAAWFNAKGVDLTLTIDGEEVTMNLKNWSDALNGTTVTDVNGVERCYGDGIADVEIRLDILAAIEGEILDTYNYIPMLQDAGMSLLSKQVYYVIDEYNPIMGRGGIRYMKYNYTDSEWASYVERQGGNLTY